MLVTVSVTGGYLLKQYFANEGKIEFTPANLNRPNQSYMLQPKKAKNEKDKFALTNNSANSVDMTMHANKQTGNAIAPNRNQNHSNINEVLHQLHLSKPATLNVHSEIASLSISSSTISNQINEKNEDEKKESIKNQNKEEETCNAYFDFYTTFDNGYYFLPKQYGSHTKLHWDFGDGKQSRDAKPKHIFQKAGSYVVTLSSTNSKTGCKTETYQLIRVVKGVDLTASVISGTVFMNAEYAAKTKVELLRYDLTSNTYKVYQTAFTNNKGYYEFNEIESGNYLIQASGNGLFRSSFYGNTDDISYANVVTIFDNDYKELSGYDIQLKATDAYASNDLRANQSDTGGKWMIVLDENNNPITTVKLNTNGSIQTTPNIPSGNYNLVDPETGKIDGSMSIGNGTSKVSLGPPSGGLGDIQLLPEIQLVPNPASEVVRVNIINGRMASAEVKIINGYGSTVIAQTVQYNGQPIPFNINSLSVGTYYVVVKQGNSSSSSILVKSADHNK
ncbi:MAG: PKD domain-containing protein [Bacteroidota bacterium]